MSDNTRLQTGNERAFSFYRTRPHSFLKTCLLQSNICKLQSLKPLSARLINCCTSSVPPTCGPNGSVLPATASVRAFHAAHKGATAEVPPMVSCLPALPHMHARSHDHAGTLHCCTEISFLHLKNMVKAERHGTSGLHKSVCVWRQGTANGDVILQAAV